MIGDGEAFSDSLEELETGEDDNLKKTKQVLGSLWGAAAPTVSLYEVLAQCIQKRDDAGKHEVLYGISVFLLSAKRSASTGVLTLGRLHLQEATYMTRRCIELVGFSYRSWKHPESLRTWLFAGGSSTAYEEYQDAFSSRKLRGDLKELGGGLLDKYDRTNKMIHASLYSLARSFEHEKFKDGGSQIRIHDFDVKRHDQWPNAALELLLTLECHISATSALAAKLLEDKPARDARKLWKQTHDPVVAAYRREKAAWKDRVFAAKANLRQRIDTGQGV